MISNSSQPEYDVYKGLETNSCCICKHEYFKLKFIASVQEHQRGVFSLDEFPIVECNNCGLLFVNPRISKEANFNYYRFAFEGDREFLENHFIETTSFQENNLKRYLRLLKKHKPEGKLLDVGAGNGFFLRLAKEAGFVVVGQDISSYFIELCKDFYDIDILNGEIEHLELESNSFDIITLFDVIEHVYHPDILLREIHRILKPDGILLITTHDAGNFFARFYGANWRMVYPVGHVYYFSSSTLRKLLDVTRFVEISHGLAYVKDISMTKELVNYLRTIFFSSFLRACLLIIYKPFTALFSKLRNWKIKLGKRELNHEKLMFMTGNQFIFNDEIISISKPK